MEIELIADYPCKTGEGPLWHTDESSLYWVDIPNGVLYRYNPETKVHESVYQTGVIGGVTIQADGSLLLFCDAGTVKRWDNGTVEAIATLNEAAETRFNDVIADPEGRIFCGTMPTDDELGSLYRLDSDGSFTRIIDAVDIPNGMGFSPDLETFYFTESGEHLIYDFDYNRDTGAISNPSILVETTDEEGAPDGLTVDTNGDIWSARWDGNVLVRYSSNGVEKERVKFPVRKVSSATFGGPALESLYVTTAGGNDRVKEGAFAGSLFRYVTNSSGRTEFRSRIRLDE
ncbi:gluconolaconase [Haloferax sp. Atlit-4N]|uniref:SMP-30/gluconolactonase/LRE family protein n=1 Tax=unclassified Haloferax TaxID=2625095 RepID=UPI000E253511|nr:MULTISPECIES: SMP-30/gluconolactonase/LRE family protein [unclassified Haloferax]RDZ39510.1 gluconolaconase [Haloferax sp. Atlit-19N]RDZ49834.1 gluconolaconase [Haloferax sp. Atlit-4N]